MMPAHARASCEGRSDLVDAANLDATSPEAIHLRRLCALCPLAEPCLEHAMAHREHGIWGGMTLTARTRRGAPASSSDRVVEAAAERL